jgi:hypothetical protein
VAHEYRLEVTSDEAAMFGGVEVMLIAGLAAAADDNDGIDGPFYWTHLGIEACARLFRRFADHAQGIDECHE